MGRSSVRPHIVFIPGFMGSVLADRDTAKKILDNPEKARAECRENVGGSANLLARIVDTLIWDVDPCQEDKFHAIFWGQLDMLYWVVNLPDWVEVLLSGDGKCDPGRAILPYAPTSASNLLRFEVYKTDGEAFIFDPYRKFIETLKNDCDAKAKVFAYDWRLSNRCNARRLADWVQLEYGRKVPKREEDKITIIAHSMGGLIARHYIESENLNGHRYVRQLITAGTPHRGAPETYARFIGVVEPLGEVPYFREIHKLLGLFGVDSPIYGIDPKTQQRLIQSWASTIEMMPNYDFVEQFNGEKQRVDKTYLFPHLQIQGREFKIQGRFYHPNDIRVIHKDFWSQLIKPEYLDHWLASKQIHYHLIGLDTHYELVGGKLEGATITGYDERKGSVITSSKGDGVVPWESALLWPYSDRASNIHPYPLGEKSESGLTHQELFQSRDIQDFCCKLVLEAYESKPGPGSMTLDQVKSSNLQAIVRMCVFSSFGRSWDVISVIKVVFHTSEREPELTLGVKFTDATRTALERRLPGTQNNRVYLPELKQDFPELGKRRFLLIEAVDKSHTSYHGGVIFVPLNDYQPYLEIITWNTTIDKLDEHKGNESHAEQQLTKWLGKMLDSEEYKGWKDKVKAIYVKNEGTKKYSPCSQCCEDLFQLRKRFSHLEATKISWKRPYTGLSGGQTDVDKLKRAHWILDGPVSAT